MRSLGRTFVVCDPQDSAFIPHQTSPFTWTLLAAAQVCGKIPVPVPLGVVATVANPKKLCLSRPMIGLIKVAVYFSFNLLQRTCFTREHIVPCASNLWVDHRPKHGGRSLKCRIQSKARSPLPLARSRPRFDIGRTLAFPSVVVFSMMRVAKRLNFVTRDPSAVWAAAKQGAGTSASLARATDRTFRLRCRRRAEFMRPC